MEERFFTARATDEGQPDRAADIIADVILDEYLKVDPETKADIKVTLTKNRVYVFGEISSSKEPDIEKAIRTGLKEIGYEDNKSGIDPYKCDIVQNIQKQSQDIARSLHPRDGDEIPASDTGMIYGYATNEDPNFLPRAYNISDQLCKRLSFVRKSGVIDGLLPDAQVCVTMEYLHDIPQRIASIVLTSHHKADVDLDWLRMEISEKVISNVCKKNIDSNTKLLINPGGRFIIGGPAADTGVSGRRVENETYGGIARYGVDYTFLVLTRLKLTAPLLSLQGRLR
jgi:S-adenosylmethionine synthetase